MRYCLLLPATAVEEAEEEAAAAVSAMTAVAVLTAGGGGSSSSSSRSRCCFSRDKVGLLGPYFDYDKNNDDDEDIMSQIISDLF